MGAILFVGGPILLACTAFAYMRKARFPGLGYLLVVLLALAMMYWGILLGYK